MSDKKEDKDFDMSLQESSFVCEEFNDYDDLEQSLGLPAFEFSSPISSISSNCSSPERTTVQQQNRVLEFDMDDDSDEFVSLEELRSRISPPSDDELCTTNSATLIRKSILETIYEDVYLETPPGTPLSGVSDNSKKRKRRLVRTDLSKLDEFKENVQNNS